MKLFEGWLSLRRSRLLNTTPGNIPLIMTKRWGQGFAELHSETLRLISNEPVSGIEPSKRVHDAQVLLPN